MLLLSYFDRILGPLIFLTNPQNLINELREDYKEQIKSLIDSENDGFFTHTFSPELKTANWIIKLDSKWARGRYELVMISIIISEEEPDFASYEKILEKFVDKVYKITDVFKAFYINNEPPQEKDEIQTKYALLKEELNNLYKILIIKKIETEGQLISFSKLKNNRYIELSGILINKLSDLTQKKQNCFIVFRTRGETVKMDLIPVETDKIFNLVVIFGEQLNLNILQQISKVFTKYEHEITLIFTSGICQEADKCLYEVYITTDMEKLNILLEEIYRIPGIIEIDVKLIELKI
jgi:hypothetical protein